MITKLYGVGKVLRGRLCVPGDKSISHRAIMFSSLVRGKTVVEGFLPSEDCLSTMDIFRKLGVSIEREDTKLTIEGKGMEALDAPASPLYCGNSGTTMRLMAGILSGQGFSSVLYGDESLEKRPMGRVLSPLSKMGAKIFAEGEKSTAPLKIEGSALKGISYESPIASAQVKSAVLLASLYAKGETVYTEPSLSRDHTERLLSAMGADIETKILEDGKAEIHVRPGKPLHTISGTFSIPGAISSAAYFMAACFFLPGSEVLLENVGLNESRSGILEVLSKMGAKFQIQNKRTVGGEERGDILLSYGKLQGAEISGSLIPRLIDELPVLAVLATIAEGETVIMDAEELKVKETNRIRAVIENFKILGIPCEETEDGMRIFGKGSIFPLDGKRVSSFKDHRIAMSFAVLGLLCPKESPMEIEDAECISISYPSFFKDLENLLDENPAVC